MEIEIPNLCGLLELARRGDTEAFGEICRAYETPLLRQALTLCGDSALAEDLAEDTLVEAWRCFDRYSGRCQLFTWLCAILLNRYRNTLRERRPVPLTSLLGSHQDAIQQQLREATDPQSRPDEAAQIRERSTLMLECVRTLPLHHQQVIFLRFYVDHSIEGIAEAIGCSVGTVKSRLFRALDNLRAMRAIHAEAENLESPIKRL